MSDAATGLVKPRGLNISVQSEDERFEEAIMIIGSMLSQIATGLAMPRVSVTVRDVSNFVGAVREASERADFGTGHLFTTERIGGQVAAKNIPLNRAGSEVEVIFDASMRPANPSGMDEAQLVFLIAHELTHPILARLRHASGALAGVPFPSVTPSEGARSLTRYAVDELRCDLVADMILRGTVKASLDGESVEFRFGHLNNGGYLAAFEEALNFYVHPGWPDAVESYRRYEIGLDEMWHQVASQTDQLFTLLAHAQAETRTLGLPGVFAGSTGTHPGVLLYLAPAWNTVLEVLSTSPLIPDLKEFAAIDQQIADAGERALLQMWETLGLTVDERSDRTFAIWVSDPVR